jgi:serine protease Do
LNFPFLARINSCMARIAILLCATFAVFLTASAAETRDAKVRNDRATVQATGLWIYNDLPAGFAEAKTTGKPLLIVLRCVP